MKTGRNRTKQLLIAGILCLLCLLIAAGGLWGAGLSGGAQTRKRQIALILKSGESEFFRTVYSGAQVAAAEYHASLSLYACDTEENAGMQNELIAQAVSDGAQAMILSAIDYEGNAEAVDRAARAGVRIVSIDSDVNSRAVSARIGTDNRKAGEKAAEAILSGTEGPLSVGIVNFDQNTANGQEREEGFRNALSGNERVCSLRAINVRSSIVDARLRTEELLGSYPEINALVTFNEWTSLGVARALRKLQLQEEVFAVGFDSNTVSVGMLETGELDALVVQNPYAMGYLGVETACALLDGERGPGGGRDTSVTLVSRENMFLPEYQKLVFPYD